jgi:predicted transport protein
MTPTRGISRKPGTGSKSRPEAKAKPKPRAGKKAKPKPEREGYHLPVRSESEQLAGLSPDLLEAWGALRALLLGLGEQEEIRTSHRSIMFSRKTCFAFVRPKRKFLELNFFLPEMLGSELVHKATAVSKTKFVHVVHVGHSDQVDWPLTDWLREAYRFSG